MSDTTDEFKRVNSIFETEVVAGRDFGAVEQVYTKDARILPPGADMLTGLDHISGFWQQAITTLNVKSLKLTTVDLQIAGDTAVEVGTAEMATDLPTSPSSLKYVVVWKKEAEGWKWQIDIWNAAAESQPK